MMNEESLKIILRTYSKGGLTEDETVQLIEDLFDKTTINNYPYAPCWPQVTYDSEPKFQKFEVTCKTK